MPIRRLFLLLIIFNTLDGLLTFYGMKCYNLKEANPLLSSFEPPIILMIKIIFSLLIFFFYFQSRRFIAHKLFIFLLSFADLIYFFILILHIVWLLFAWGLFS